MKRFLTRKFFKSFNLRKQILILLPVFLYFTLISLHSLSAAEAKKENFYPDFHEAFGKINQSFFGDPNRVVLLVQDAHCNFECQSNMVEIFNSVSLNQSIPLICLEGAEGEFEANLFSGYSNKQAQQDLTLYFLRQAKLTGPEFFVIASEVGKDTELFGIDRKDLYLANLELFKNAYQWIETLKGPFQDLQKNITDLKNKIYSEKMLEFNRLEISHEKGEISFKDYFQELIKISDQNSIDISRSPQLVKQREIFDLEGKIDFEALEKERSAILDELSKKLVPEEVSQLLVQSVQFRMNRISSAKFHNLLKQLSEKTKVQTNVYPNFTTYSRYINLIPQISEPLLFDEIEALKKNIKSKILQTPLAERLNAVEEKIFVMSRLLQLKVTNDEFDQLAKNEKEYSWEKLIPALNKIAEEKQIDQFYSEDLKKLDQAIPVFKAFYQKALERDDVMLKSAVKRMIDKKSNLMVIVAGGFHTRGISKALKDKGLTYFVITPRVAKKTAETPYFSILLNRLGPLDQWLTQGAPLPVLQRPLLTSKQPLIWEEHKTGLMKLFNMVYPAEVFRGETQELGPEKRAELEMARLKLLGELSKIGDRLKASDFRVDYSNLRTVGPERSIVEMPILYRDEKGNLQREVVLMARGVNAADQIQVFSGVRGFESAQIDAKIESPQLGESGALSMAVFRNKGAISESQDKIRNQFLSAQLSVEEPTAKRIFERLSVSDLTLDALSRVLTDEKVVNADLSQIDKMEDRVNRAKEMIDALYKAAVSEQDFDMVSRLYSNLRDFIQKEKITVAPQMSTDLNNRLMVSAGAHLSFIQKGRNLADVYDQDFNLPTVLGISTSLLFDSVRVDENGNVLMVPSKNAGEAVSAIKNIIARAMTKGVPASQNLKIVLISLDKGIKPSAYPQISQNIIKLLGLPSEVTAGNPLLFVGIEEVVQQLRETEPAKAEQAERITQALYETVAAKAKVDQSAVAILAKSEKELQGHLETQLAMIIEDGGVDMSSSFTEAFTTAAVVIDEVRKLVGNRQDYEPSPELVKSLTKRFESTGWTEEKIRAALKGTAVDGVFTMPPQPKTDASSELDALGNMEEEMMGQSA